MSLIHISGYSHVNPTDVSRVDGFPLTMSIVVTMKNGDKLTRFVDEKEIDALMEPSGDEPEKWSTRQVQALFTVRTPFMHQYEEGRNYKVGGSDIFVSDSDKRFVNSIMAFTDREQAFDVKYRDFARLFNL